MIWLANAKPPRVGAETVACFKHFLAADDPAEHSDASSAFNADRSKYIFIGIETDFIKIIQQMISAVIYFHRWNFNGLEITLYHLERMFVEGSENHKLLGF